MKLFFIFSVLMLSSFFSFAQNDATTIGISGVVRLDAGVASDDYEVEISVTNHSFVVISVFPFIFIRPILSQVTQTVTIEQGQSSALFDLEGISTNALDYVIKFSCSGCDGVLTLNTIARAVMYFPR